MLIFVRRFIVASDRQAIDEKKRIAPVAYDHSVQGKKQMLRRNDPLSDDARTAQGQRMSARCGS
ncbi:hypothetical protein UB31_28415 [Bradyrhizobium sp. LTSP849]|nr:hypothetical protein UB31_28415 [Bradyrhizobium sp. LTSP849]